MDSQQLYHRRCTRWLWLVVLVTSACNMCVAEPVGHSVQKQQLHHRRRRPLDHQHAVTPQPLGDQLALANSWNVPNRVISATYAGNMDTGHVSQANVVVNVLPTHQRNTRFSDEDLANAESLANTRTAAEYVTKAMQMRGTKHQLKAPQSSYIKYDVFANQEAKVSSSSPSSSSVSQDADDDDDDDDSTNDNVDDNEPNDTSLTDAQAMQLPSSRYVISEQVTSHQAQIPHQQRPTVAAPTRWNQKSMHRHKNNQHAPVDLLSTTRTFKNFEDFEHNPRKPDYGMPHVMADPKFKHQISHEKLYNSYGTPYDNPPHDEPYDINHDSYFPQPQLSPQPPAPSTELPKSEMIKHIQHSVLKYMQELEAAGRFTTTTTSTTTTPSPPSAPVEVKTYYRIPAHHTSSETHEAINKYHYGMGRGKSTYPKTQADVGTTSAPPLDYYRVPAESVSSSTQEDSYFPISMYTTASSAGIKSYPATTMSSITYHAAESGGHDSTPHIDLTFRSKARPKPIDLAALDVGQSWSHDPEQHSGSTASQTVYYRYPGSASPAGKHAKPLHFSAQTYHDINSMTYVPGKPSATESSYGIAESEQTPVRFKDEPSAVVSYPEPVSDDELLNDVQQHYRAPIHIINGIPVANPYKFNVEQLKQMFGGTSDDKEHRGMDDVSDEDRDDAPSKQSGWQPSFSPVPSYTKPRGPKTHHRDQPPTHNHNLPYESYTTSGWHKPQHQSHHQLTADTDDDGSSSYNVDGWQTIGYGSHSGGGGNRPTTTSNRTKKYKHSGSSSAGSASLSPNMSPGDKKRHKKRRPPAATSLMKGKAKLKHGKKSRSLETELRPPPAGTIY